MHVPVLQLVNFCIILVVMVFLVRYLWDLFFGSDYALYPWDEARKQGRLSPSLIKVSRQFPDKVRFYSFWLQMDRLQREGIAGDLAELGVYKGHTAKVLHHLAPTRRLHLFDTFTGFNQTDLDHERGLARHYSEQDFADTSIKKVLQNIGAPEELVKIHAGDFADTSLHPENNNLGFAMVSLDADLYRPTSLGLKYFYPRLAPGGALFVHDYNRQWEGLMQAVDEFLLQIPESPVLLPDLDSTLLIVKNKTANN